MIRVHLDILPPTVNEMYKRSRYSFYKSTEAKQTVEAIQLLMRTQYRGNPLDHEGIVVSVNLHAKNKRRDIDGMLKALLDCGNKILWKDDSLITELHVFKLKGDDTVDVVIEAPDAV